jgi:hypothetical protein
MLRYQQLKLLENGGVISHLTLQPQFPVEINGGKFCTYTADFQYVDVASGLCLTEDVKTPATEKEAAYRLRKKAAELFHGITIYAVDKDGRTLKPPRARKAVVKKRGSHGENRGSSKRFPQ